MQGPKRRGWSKHLHVVHTFDLRETHAYKKGFHFEDCIVHSALDLEVPLKSDYVSSSGTRDQCLGVVIHFPASKSFAQPWSVLSFQTSFSCGVITEVSRFQNPSQTIWMKWGLSLSLFLLTPPQLVEVAEHEIRILLNHIWCPILSANMPKTFWVDALQNKSHTINLVPCYTLAGFVSPHSLLSLSLVEASCLHPFGCQT